jgi:mannose-6-phosphate isomerase-like protein (cupin superfamily)
MPSSEVSNPGMVFEKQGAVVRILVSSRDTRGEYMVCEVQTTAPIEVPQHLHTYEDQWYHILEGRYQFVIAGQPVFVGPGGVVAVPRQSSSSMCSAEPGKFLIVARPGGMDLFFQDAHAAGEIALVLEKHGIILQP